MTPEEHFDRYRVYQRWSEGLRWSGATTLVLSATLLCTGNAMGCVITLLAFIPIAIARDTCAEHADQHFCASYSRLWREDP